MAKSLVYDKNGELKPENLKLKREKLKTVLSEKDVVFHMIDEMKRDYRRRTECSFFVCERKKIRK